MLNLLDLEPEVALPVAGLAPVAHLVLVLEDDDLAPLDLADHVGQDARPRNRGLPDGDVLAVADQQDLVERDLATSLGRELLDVEALAGLNPVLTASR